MAKKKNTSKESKETKGKAPAPRQTKARLVKQQKEIPHSSDFATEMTGKDPESSIHFVAPSHQDIDGRIASRAYELYQNRGDHHGQDPDDWLEAECQVLAETQGF